MFIDIHTHAYHPKIAHKVCAMLQNHYGIPPVGTGQVDDLLARAAKADIGRVAVHTAATTQDQVIPANNWALELKRQHPEIVPFGTIHPDFADWETQLDNLLANGITGIKLHPDFQGFFLDDDRLGPIFESMSGRFTVMIHVGDRLPPEKNPSCPFKVARILKDFPKLRVIAAHLGGYLHWEWSIHCLAGKKVYMDTSSSLSFISDEHLHAIISRHNPSRLLFGSDYPLFDPLAEMKHLSKRLKLKEVELERYMTNAAVLL